MPSTLQQANISWKAARNKAQKERASRTLNVGGARATPAATKPSNTINNAELRAGSGHHVLKGGFVGSTANVAAISEVGMYFIKPGLQLHALRAQLFLDQMLTVMNNLTQHQSSISTLHTGAGIKR